MNHQPATQPAAATPLKLHVGGEIPKAGWKIYNIVDGPHVDYVGDVVDLSRFTDASVAEIYASHVYEHLGYAPFLDAIAEVARVLKPGGIFRLAVPDMERLCALYLQPELSLDDRVHLTHLFFGGQTNPYDFHRLGLNFAILATLLHQAGFREMRRVESFGLFDDCSEYRFKDIPISLNVIALR
jgi:predicted SAM-dependent methyltransferase